MKFFGRNKAKEKSALSDRFREAAYGGAFQTVSYSAAGNMDKKNWRRAVRMPGQGWAVFNHLQVSAGGVVDQEPCATGLTFFQAVENLAVFEASQEKSGWIALGEEEQKQALGPDHVQAFAEREGIAFDMEGLPHATLEGIIVDKGLFSLSAHEKAMAAYYKRRGSEAGLSDLGANLSDGEFRRLRASSEHIEQVLKPMKAIRNDIASQKTFAAFYMSAMEDQKFKWDSGEDLHENIKLLFVYPEVLLTGDPAVDELTAKPLLLFKFLVAAGQAASMQAHVDAGECEGHPRRDECSSAQVAALEDRANKFLLDLGYREGVEQATYRIFRKYLGEAETKEKWVGDLDGVMNYLEDTKAYCDARMGIVAAPGKKSLPDEKKIMARLLPPAP